MASRGASLPDGSPVWLPQAERWLVGAALLSSREDVVTAAAVCSPEDFRDDLLREVWAVLPVLDCPCVAHVVDRLGAEHAPELVELAGSQGAWLYASRICLEAHAVLVRREGEKRRALRQLVADANVKATAIRNGAPTASLYDRPEYQNMTEAV